MRNNTGLGVILEFFIFPFLVVSWGRQEKPREQQRPCLLWRKSVDVRRVGVSEALWP